MLPLLLALLAAAQQPQIQNGAVETRQATSLDRDLAAIASSAAEPVWVGWRETAAAFVGNACCWYQTDTEFSRGCTVEPQVPNTRGFAGMNEPDPRPAFPAPSGPVKLEAGTDVVVMLRVVPGSGGKQIERIRTFSDDCPLDAGGRKVIWLDRVPTAESVRYLSSLIELQDVSGTPTALRRRINGAAISAIGMHRDGNVDELIALARQSTDTSARSAAMTALGRSRDPKAIAFIDGVLRK